MGHALKYPRGGPLSHRTEDDKVNLVVVGNAVEGLEVVDMDEPPVPVNLAFTPRLKVKRSDAQGCSRAEK